MAPPRACCLSYQARGGGGGEGCQTQPLGLLFLEELMNIVVGLWEPLTVGLQAERQALQPHFPCLV